MISAKQAKAITLAAIDTVSVSPRCSFYEALEIVVGQYIDEACHSKCDTVEVKFEHTPAEVNATILLVDHLRSLGYYARSFFNNRCTESKIVIGWGKA